MRSLTYSVAEELIKTNVADKRTRKTCFFYKEESSSRLSSSVDTLRNSSELYRNLDRSNAQMYNYM
jgi:hypothetical protein